MTVSQFIVKLCNSAINVKWCCNMVFLVHVNSEKSVIAHWLVEQQWKSVILALWLAEQQWKSAIALWLVE